MAAIIFLKLALVVVVVVVLVIVIFVFVVVVALFCALLVMVIGLVIGLGIVGIRLINVFDRIPPVAGGLLDERVVAVCARRRRGSGNVVATGRLNRRLRRLSCRLYSRPRRQCQQRWLTPRLASPKPEFCEDFS